MAARREISVNNLEGVSGERIHVRKIDVQFSVSIFADITFGLPEYHIQTLRCCYSEQES